MFSPEEPLSHGTVRPGNSRKSPASLLNLAVELERKDAEPPARPAAGRSQVSRERALPDAGTYRAEKSEKVAAQPSVAGLPGLERLDSIGIAEVLGWLRDGLGWIVASLIICLAAALAYGFLATPKYTVYTDILVDPSNLNVVSDDVFTSSPQRDAQLLEVESKLRVLVSRNVLNRVIDDLNLTEDPEFVKPSLLETIKGLLGMGQSGTSDSRLAVMRALSERVEASREERSFIVVLKVWSEEPLKAVALSEAIVKAFEQEMFESTSASAGRVAQDIDARLSELRASATAAETSVETFRREHGLLVTGDELESARLSSELNSQVLDAQERVIQAQSQYQQMQDALAAGRSRSASVFESDTMVTLREQYNTLRQRIGSLELSLGTRHPRLIEARSELRTLENAIDDEARAILERAKASYDQEQAALNALRAKAGEETSNVYLDNEAQVQLRDLERDAKAKTQLYETFLARSQEITQRQQIDTTNIRVISGALPPKAPSWPPRKLLLLAAGGMAGLMLGIGLALTFGFWRFLRAPRYAVA